MRRLSCLFVILSMAWLGVRAPLSVGQEALKLEQEVRFSIKEGPLEGALIQFSRQAQMQVLLAPDMATNITASAVHGTFSAADALAALLKGTGLAYTAFGNTVTIQPARRK